MPGHAEARTQEVPAPEPDLTPEAIVDRARALIPRLAERAPACTASRVIPPETIAAYHEAGIVNILQPRRFGARAEYRDVRRFQPITPANCSSR